MSVSDVVIERYGADIRIGEKCSRGFIQAKNPENPDIVRKPLGAGIANDESYLLIAESDAFPCTDGEKMLHCGGLVYEILRIEPIMFGNELSHWEAVMRLRGRETNV